MLCPLCATPSRVINSRLSPDGTHTIRRRQCEGCHARWSTRETKAGEITTTNSTVKHLTPKITTSGCTSPP